MNRQNYFLGGLVEAVAGGLDFFSDTPIIGGLAESAADTVYDFADYISPDDVIDVVEAGSYGATDYGFSASDFAPSFFDQAVSSVREGISDLSFGLLSAEDIKSGAGLLAKEALSASKRGSSAQQQARSRRSEVLGAGRGVGVSGSAPARQFTPGSVQSMIARTNAGKQAFQPGTVDTRQNLVNIVAEAFTETGATSPTGAGKISPSASKIEKVGTSYFS
ncbi:MAG: hypothetical protein VW270_16255 [Candidatus Poseidoniales archaeon]